MRFVYSTDLHGNKEKYEAVLAYALKKKIRLIHLGADLLPKGSGILEKQKRFIKTYLKDFFKRTQDNQIKVLCHFGNDDIYTRKKYFKKISVLLDEETYEQDGYLFNAYSYVPDYRFPLKTACKLDYTGWWCPDEYINEPIDAGEQGFYKIEDIKEYFSKKTTIETDLTQFKGGKQNIISIHCPPADYDLDVCGTKFLPSNIVVPTRRVGSKSILKWIIEKQPLLVLCGHIHESFRAAGKWYAKIGNTTVIQPGQEEEATTIVDINIENGIVDADLDMI